MSLGNLCRKDVVTVKPGTLVKEVTKLMEEKNIGSVIITDDKEMFGIITDRDIALGIVNKDMNPQQTTVDELMTHNFVLVLREDIGLFEALEQVKKSAVRRFPVVGIDGNLKGIITIDDRSRNKKEWIITIISRG